MTRLYKILFISTLLLLAYGSHAQVKVYYDEPRNNQAAIQDTEQDVILHADPRIADALKRHKEAITGTIYSARGYRVQIYSGNDRAKATHIKIDFIRRFPGIRTYMTYVSPQFRVKIGDYRTRADAEKMYEQVSTLYTPCMIVPDIIVINTLKDD